MADETCPECGSRLQNAPGYVGQLPDGSPMGSLMHCTNGACDRFWGHRSVDSMITEPPEIANLNDARIQGASTEAPRSGGARLVAVRDALLRHPALSGYAIFFLLALVSRLAYMHSPLDQDVGGYLYVGKTILRGGVPYVDAAEPKGPVFHLLFAGIAFVSGQHVLLVHLTLVVFMAFAALAVAGYVTEFAGRSAGALAGTILAVLGSAGVVFGYVSNSEQYGIAVMAGAWFFAVRGTKQSALAAGALVAAAIWMNLGFAVIGVIVGFELLLTKGPTTRAMRVAFAAIGAVGLSAVVLLWLAAHGAIGDMKIQMWDYAQKYTHGQLLLPGPPKNPGSFRNLVDVLAPEFWIAGLVGGCIGLTSRQLRRPAMGALLWIVLMWARIKIPAQLGSATWAHHYYTVMPGIAVGMAVGIAAVWGTSPKQRAAVAVMVLALPVYAYVIGPQWQDLQQPATSRGYWGSNGASDNEMAAFIDANTRPSDRIFVVFDQAQIYWEANRQAPDRWFVDYVLEAFPKYARDRERDFRAAPPAAIAAKSYVLGGIEPEVQRLLDEYPYRLAYQGNGDKVWLFDRGALKAHSAARTKS